MERLNIQNPFGQPVYYVETCSSTMDEARRLAEEGARHGTAVMAGLQTNGRGRRETRKWTASAGKNLTFTLILRYPDFSHIPTAITLRSGLAAARAAADFEPALAPKIAVKWPNDVMLGDKKCAGILAESNGSVVLIGIGVNVTEDFSGAPLAGAAYEAASIAGELALLNVKSAHDYTKAADNIALLLEKVLDSLSYTLSPAFDGVWRQELERILYMKGQTVRFSPGGVTDAACRTRLVTGRLTGIDADGSILIIPEGKTSPESFAAGELPSAGFLPCLQQEKGHCTSKIRKLKH
ncbi:MAG: biotin--[acetyl-CoA-carboxylase] ligase [Spirochaetaceae bacterium]|jgi:BirA family biotin operon repressor/biotin-[acetyl-CoA-carboxylase] ligase|nr:biotin--[acetyl-CoA-carboxylase] ligase [Spirochaetaceae bacterium]